MISLSIFIERLRDGGAERIAVTLQNELSKSMNSQLVTMYDGENPYSLSSDYYKIINKSIPISRVKRYALLPYIIFKYVRYLKKEKISVVLSILGSANICNIISSLFVTTVPIISLHIEPKYKFSHFNQLAEWCLGLGVRVIPKAKVVAVSNDVKEQYHQLYNIPYEKIVVLYNPIETKLIEINAMQDILPSLTLFEENIPIVITAGRLNKVKGQDHLIRSFANLRSERPVHLLICGIGEDEPYLKTLVNNLGIENDVTFLGWQKNPHQYISRSTVFVLSSISEALPNVLVEAMAVGCPVIAADSSPGVREIIGENNEYGLLAEKMTGIRHVADEPLDSGEKSLLRLMRMIIDDSKLRGEYIRRGKERAEFFSVDRRIKVYEKFILENGNIK